MIQLGFDRPCHLYLPQCRLLNCVPLPMCENVFRYISETFLIFVATLSNYNILGCTGVLTVAPYFFDQYQLEAQGYGHDHKEGSRQSLDDPACLSYFLRFIHFLQSWCTTYKRFVLHFENVLCDTLKTFSITLSFPLLISLSL